MLPSAAGAIARGAATSATRRPHAGGTRRKEPEDDTARFGPLGPLALLSLVAGASVLLVAAVRYYDRTVAAAVLSETMPMRADVGVDGAGDGVGVGDSARGKARVKVLDWNPKARSRTYKHLLESPGSGAVELADDRTGGSGASPVADRDVLRYKA
eukprot:4614320-Prymnesium_polylepis.1